MDVFIPDPIIPNHFNIPDHVVLMTSDFSEAEFRWARVIRNNYVEGRGFITTSGDRRLGIELKAIRDDGSYMELNTDYQLKQFVASLDPSRSTILWYRPDGSVKTVITDVANDVQVQLPAQYQRFYHN